MEIYREQVRDLLTSVMLARRRTRHRHLLEAGRGGREPISTRAKTPRAKTPPPVWKSSSELA